MRLHGNRVRPSLRDGRWLLNHRRREFDDWLEEMKEANGPADRLKIQGNWRNFKSDGLAVHPDQCELAEQLEEQAARLLGHLRPGRRQSHYPRSCAERKRLLRIEKVHDNDAGYSD